MTDSTNSPPLGRPTSAAAVDLLILGAGWTSLFLIPLLESHHPTITFATTTRDGRNGSIQWTFDPEKLLDPNEYKVLPEAKTVLITFPIKEQNASRNLVETFERVKCRGNQVRWIQLGSTGIWDGSPTLVAQSKTSQPPAYTSTTTTENPEKENVHDNKFKWIDRHSPYDVTNPRAIAEDELLSVHSNTFVLNLAGLWGGERDPSNWIGRIASSKQALEVKGSLHLIHGLDVARAIVAVHLSTTNRDDDHDHDKVVGKKGERYLLTDLRVIDWWDLASRYCNNNPNNLSTSSTTKGLDSGPFEWVQELIEEHAVRGLPRSAQELGRALDSREFWSTFKLTPIRASYEKGRL
ncbi:uncharacterized protein JCM15063_002003 [Sporobolomyces koalae]|uniref:uncharacterized protein n=1 Tax=Sporobolomyces koalae TaxID=500713 RepID=UPI00316E9D1D